MLIKKCLTECLDLPIVVEELPLVYQFDSGVRACLGLLKNLFKINQYCAYLMFQLYCLHACSHWHLYEPVVYKFDLRNNIRGT